MAGETSNIQEMANLVSDRLFRWFKWDKVELMDENFDCVKVESHSNKKESHTHPVDIVFKYLDPYLNKQIYLNTDLKSYKKKSITPNSLRDSLKSLAYTIDCARASQEWQSRYIHDEMDYEIRGMLFVYNHDGDYDKKFYDVITPPKGSTAKGIRTDNLPIAKGQQIHLVEPLLINYMSTITSDMSRLHHEGTFPQSSYEFFYPELLLHRTHGNQASNPATIEALSSPYLIIYHNDVEKFNEKTRSTEKTFDEGYLIYFNRPGKNAKEFVYLFDSLSKYQILNDKHKIRIRVAHHSPDKNISSHFKAAINIYASDWNFDEYKLKHLENIEFGLVEITKDCFSSTEVARKR